MPTYDYRCAKCGNEIEVFQSFAEEPLSRHVGCGGKLAKVLSPAGIVLKGSGFYKNDSADSSRSRSKSRSEAHDAPALRGQPLRLDL
jgi:putative FmdB family regulatory protein